MRRYLSIDGFHGGLLAVGRILILSSLIILTACKAQRMIDASHRSRPDWVYGVQRGFLIGNGAGRDINEARAGALNNIKSQIAQAVFSEIQSRKQFNISEVQRGKAFELITSFLSETISTTNHGIVTRGVSLSDANDFYYEVVKDRETRRETVKYSVKYPFSRMEMESYLREWDRRQQSLVEQKNEIAARVGNHESIEQIFSDVIRLLQLKELLVGEHSLSVDFLITDIYSYMNGIRVEIFEEGPGYIYFGLLNGDDIVKTSVRPRITPDGVIVEGVHQTDNRWRVTYREDEHITGQGIRPQMTFLFTYRTWKLEYTHLLSPEIELSIISPMIFHGTRFSFFGTKVRAIDYIIKTEVTGMGGVVLERIMMHPVKLEGYRRLLIQPLTFDLGKDNLVRSGNDYKRMSFETDLSRNEYSTGGNSGIIVNGSLYYRELITGERKTLEFSGIELRTDW